MSAPSWTTRASFLGFVFPKNDVDCISYSTTNLTRILPFRSHHRVQMTGIEPALHRWNHVLSVAGLPFPHIWMFFKCSWWDSNPHLSLFLKQVPIPVRLHEQFFVYAFEFDGNSSKPIHICPSLPLFVPS